MLAPSQRGHLDRRQIAGFLTWVDQIVHHRRPAIYAFIAVVTALGIVGALRINAIGYVVDDLPKNDPIYTDLKWIESRFKGVMPFEVSIDTKRPRPGADALNGDQNPPARTRVCQIQ